MFIYALWIMTGLVDLHLAIWLLRYMTFFDLLIPDFVQFAFEHTAIYNIYYYLLRI